MRRVASLIIHLFKINDVQGRTIEFHELFERQHQATSSSKMENDGVVSIGKEDDEAILESLYHRQLKRSFWVRATPSLYQCQQVRRKEPKSCKQFKDDEKPTYRQLWDAKGRCSTGDKCAFKHDNHKRGRRRRALEKRTRCPTPSESFPRTQLQRTTRRSPSGEKDCLTCRQTHEKYLHTRCYWYPLSLSFLQQTHDDSSVTNVVLSTQRTPVALPLRR